MTWMVKKLDENHYLYIKNIKGFDLRRQESTQRKTYEKNTACLPFLKMIVGQRMMLLIWMQKEDRASFASTNDKKTRKTNPDS